MQKTVLALCLAVAFTHANVNAMVFAEAPAQDIRSLMAEARDAQSRKDFNAAAEFYRRAIELDPSVPEVWANLGLMQHESGKLAEAIRSFKEAIKLDGSLFVPNLFLGIEYLESKNSAAAIPFLEKAEKLEPNDLQAAINLGKAYALSNRPDHAAEAYSRATRLAPNDGNTWLSLGMAYLQQVESDARLMTSTYDRSPYIILRTAETFAEEGKLLQAENAYKSAISTASPAPCTHAEFGITLLRKKNVAEAKRQFEQEEKTGSHCGLAALGLAVAQLADGHPDAAFTSLTSISVADPGFISSSLPLFRDTVSADQARSLIDLIGEHTEKDPVAIEIGSLARKTFTPEDASALSEVRAGLPPSVRTPSPANAERLYAAGHYAKCKDALTPALGSITGDRLQLLASCSFYTGDFGTTAIAAQRLKSDTTTRASGLYWECKADQNLAIAALLHAGELDADSPRMHVVLGNAFRQERRWDDAEMEYRKAIALDRKSHAARLSLAIVLFSKLMTDEALEIDRSLLAENPNDPEANLLGGEILVQQNLFVEAEQYLSKCRNLQPEFAPRLHVLLAKVYAVTNRIPEAISEFKEGLSTDEDGSVHYQLARLYQKTGDKLAADMAFKDSKRIRGKWDESAHIALGQSATDVSNQ